MYEVNISKKSFLVFVANYPAMNRCFGTNQVATWNGLGCYLERIRTHSGHTSHSSPELVPFAAELKFYTRSRSQMYPTYV